MAACTILLFLGVAGLSACQKRAQTPAAPAAAPTRAAPTRAASAPSAASVPRAPFDSGPQIVMSADAVHIEYTVHGAGDPAVVLVHGWACNSHYWQAQIGVLAARYAVVTLNLAGHGGSGRNRVRWTLEAFGGDIATVVRALPERHIVLVGNGMGAAAALEAARSIGSRLLGVIAVDALQSIGQPPLPRREVERRLAPLRANFIGATRDLAATLLGSHADAELKRKVMYDMSLAAPAAAIPSLDAYLSWNPGPALLSLHVPVLAINSDLTPTDQARIARYLPGFHVDVVKGTGHLLMLEAPQRFNPLLLKDIDLLVRRARRASRL